MLAKAYANPKLAAVLVGTIVGLVGAAIFSLAGWLDGETPSVGFVVLACLVGFGSTGAVGTMVAYLIFARVNEGDEKRKEREKPRSKT